MLCGKCESRRSCSGHFKARKAEVLVNEGGGGVMVRGVASLSSRGKKKMNLEIKILNL